MSTQQADAPLTPARPLRCVVAGGSLVGLSVAIALSRLGLKVTVAERSPARAADGARSTVRATVDPHHDARYAGVLLWRTLVDEQAMLRNVTLPRKHAWRRPSGT